MEIKENTRVGYNTGSQEYKLGKALCSPNYNNLVLVRFDLGYSRWVNISNLELITKTGSTL